MKYKQSSWWEPMSIIFGTRHHDIIHGTYANDWLFGFRGDDVLYGYHGNDFLFGHRGDDWLDGGSGNDTYVGGRGADHFVVRLYDTDHGVRAQGHDVIVDLKANDTLLIDGDIYNQQMLNDAVVDFEGYGRTLHITFEGGGSLKLHGIHHARHINSFDDLDQAVGHLKMNIQFTNEYRTIDGKYNNPHDYALGSADQAFLRYAPHAYVDGISDPADEFRPSARVISNEIFQQDNSIPNAEAASNMIWLWGQFVDHDIDLTPTGSLALDITVPTGDPWFDPDAMGDVVIPLTRSQYYPGAGENGVAAEQMNTITAFIDASNIYGSDSVRAEFLRTEGGKLKASTENLLPFNTQGLPNAPFPGADFFIAGDVRANENIALTSMHTIFMREHNRLVDELANEHPQYSDERLFQEAKKWVEAEMQVITYNEFLPLLLGDDALTTYGGYDPYVNPQITNVFATAAYRLGHTMVSEEIQRVDEIGNEIAAGHLALRDAFFTPDILMNSHDTDPIIRGMVSTKSETVDTFIIDDLRNFLFDAPAEGGLDLASLNIQRGHDHGLADYNSYRWAYGLDPVTTFAEITSDVTLQQKLQTLYGNVDNIDVFVGGLAEDHLPGSMLGEFLQTVIADQFERLRDGDRFWYENDRFSAEEIANIDQITLSDIIKYNTHIDYLQQNVFLSYQRQGGDNTNNHLMGTDQAHDLLIGFAGHDVLNGLGNNDELYGGPDSDTFIFNQNSGVDAIGDFLPYIVNQTEHDLIDLTDYQTNFASLNLNSDGINTTIDIDGTNAITLLDFADHSDLTAHDFLF